METRRGIEGSSRSREKSVELERKRTWRSLPWTGFAGYGSFVWPECACSRMRKGEVVAETLAGRLRRQIWKSPHSSRSADSWDKGQRLWKGSGSNARAPLSWRHWPSVWAHNCAVIAVALGTVTTCLKALRGARLLLLKTFSVLTVFRLRVSSKIDARSLKLSSPLIYHCGLSNNFNFGCIFGTISCAGSLNHWRAFKQLKKNAACQGWRQ